MTTETRADKYAGHTPGPWGARDARDDSDSPTRWWVDGPISANPKGTVGATIGPPVANCYREEDARLIADAPALLAQRDALAEACQKALDGLGGMTTDAFSKGGDRWIRDMLDDAIAATKGMVGGRA